MKVIETAEGPVSCPDRIALIGGGRWARVLLEVLASLVPPSVAISVHSRRNIDSMAAWARTKGLHERVEWSSAWPRSKSSDPGAAIVANAARDHEATTEWALSNRFAVIVEKPVALAAASARSLANLARQESVRFAAAHIFLFARYVQAFSAAITEVGRIESLHIDWTDPEREVRYGERKRYDASLPVYSDWLPHVVSIAGALLPTPPDTCRCVSLRRGGAALELELSAAGVPCTVRMERNSDRRRRKIRAVAGVETLELDFSTEPGVIVRGFSSVTADPYWGSRRRPAACMLAAFLEWAAGGRYDERLAVGPALQACKVIEQVSGLYLSALIPWLAARLAESGTPDEEVRYSLTELLQADGLLSKGELDRRIDTVRARFADVDRARWTGLLAHPTEAARFLVSLAA